MHELTTGSVTNARIGNMSSVLRMISDELSDELNDIMLESDDNVIETYWAWISQVIAWIGHGDTGRLPEELQPFARKINGEMEPMTQHALEAG